MVTTIVVSGMSGTTLAGKRASMKEKSDHPMSLLHRAYSARRFLFHCGKQGFPLPIL